MRLLSTRGYRLTSTLRSLFYRFSATMPFYIKTSLPGLVCRETPGLVLRYCSPGVSPAFTQGQWQKFIVHPGSSLASCIGRSRADIEPFLADKNTPC
jgi:hypothetical protein